MNTITRHEELLSLLDERGVPREPFRVADGCVLDDLSVVTSPAGCTLGDGCWLYGLSSVTSLAGCTIGDGCVLRDLSAVTSLAGITIGNDCELYDLSAVTSLAGCTIGNGCALDDLSAVTSLAGLAMGNDCALDGLSACTSLAGLTMGDRCELHGLPDNCDLGLPELTDAELAIVRQIPIDRCEMGSWHCGTSHCLAGWAEITSYRRFDTALDAGYELLPHLAHLFYAPTPAVRRMLERYQAS